MSKVKRTTIHVSVFSLQDHALVERKGCALASIVSCVQSTFPAPLTTSSRLQPPSRLTSPSSTKKAVAPLIAKTAAEGVVGRNPHFLSRGNTTFLPIPAAPDRSVVGTIANRRENHWQILTNLKLSRCRLSTPNLFSKMLLFLRKH